MTEEYRLVFSGEVSEGQHAAVVKKRLAKVLKLDDERVDVLFSGKAVVIKKAVDDKTAARYQQVFQKAGARLRVLPMADPEKGGTEPSAQDDNSVNSATPAAQSSSEELQALPVGSDLLAEGDRQRVEAPEINTDHLSVQGAVFVSEEAEDFSEAPDVDHITLAELGALIGDPDGEAVVEEIDVTFDLAEVGALLREAGEGDDLESQVPDVDFEIAQVGADMDTQEKPPPPPAPDTSHIELEKDSNQDS